MIGKNTTAVSAATRTATSPCRPSGAGARAFSRRSPQLHRASGSTSGARRRTRRPRRAAPGSRRRRCARCRDTGPSNQRIHGPPGTGSYLQVAALKREDADHIVKVIRKIAGTRLSSAKARRRGCIRVLVGPYKDMHRLLRFQAEAPGCGFRNRSSRDRESLVSTSLVQISAPPARLPEWARKSADALRVAEHS